MNTLWILILFSGTGAGRETSFATAAFSTQQTCEAAGQAAKKLASLSRSNTNYVCVRS